MAEPIYIPTNSVLEFPFLHTLISTFFFFNDKGLSDKCEVISHCDFDLHFPDD